MNAKRDQDNVIDDSRLWQAVERAREKRKALGIEAPATDLTAAIRKWEEKEMAKGEEAFELELEVQVFRPDTVTSVQARLKEVIEEVFAASGLDALLRGQKPQLVFAQGLATKEGADTALMVLAFVLHEAPTAWPHLKAFLELLGTRLKKATPTTINADITIGKKKVHIEGMTPEDAIKVITKEYEVYFQPRRKGG
jgi:hypothetical protein